METDDLVNFINGKSKNAKHTNSKAKSKKGKNKSKNKGNLILTDNAKPDVKVERLDQKDQVSVETYEVSTSVDTLSNS